MSPRTLAGELREALEDVETRARVLEAVDPAARAALEPLLLGQRASILAKLTDALEDLDVDELGTVALVASWLARPPAEVRSLLAPLLRDRLAILRAELGEP